MSGQAAQPPPPQQQAPAANAPDPQDIQQKQADIGQKSGVPASTLASYETVESDQGVGTDVAHHGYNRYESEEL